MSEKFTVTLEITPDKDGELFLIQKFKFTVKKTNAFNSACSYFYKELSKELQTKIDESASIYGDLL